MAKLAKSYYKLADGSRRLNSYIWATLVLGALITTCGMIHAHLKEPAEIKLTSGKGQTAGQK